MINRIVLIRLLHAPIYLYINARQSPNVSGFVVPEITSCAEAGNCDTNSVHLGHSS
jgi:hypothetical protein